MFDPYPPAPDQPATARQPVRGLVAADRPKPHNRSNTGQILVKYWSNTGRFAALPLQTGRGHRSGLSCGHGCRNSCRHGCRNRCRRGCRLSHSCRRSRRGLAAGKLQEQLQPELRALAEWLKPSCRPGGGTWRVGPSKGYDPVTQRYMTTASEKRSERGSSWRPAEDEWSNTGQILVKC